MQAYRARVENSHSPTFVTNRKGVQLHQSSYGLYFYQSMTICTHRTSQDKFPLYSGMHGPMQSRTEEIPRYSQANIRIQGL